jgi:hypothetical protein
VSLLYVTVATISLSSNITLSMSIDGIVLVGYREGLSRLFCC